LQSKLTRGREDQCLRLFLIFKFMKNGEGEGGSLASAGLGLTNNVNAGEHEGNHPRLNGCWLSIAKLIDGLHDLAMQV
jgi:hypothetical protein